MPIGYKTVGHAISNLCTYDGRGKPAFCALDISYEVGSNGEYDFDSPVLTNPVSWDEWITLPVRDLDLCINTPNLRIRVPTVIISNRYSKMPVKFFKLTKDGIRIRDNDTCQYTGRKLRSNEGSIDHVLPKRHGGTNTWSNLVYCSKEINRTKGSNMNKDIGLTLIKDPKEPIPVSACILLKHIKHRDWKHFLTVK